MITEAPPILCFFCVSDETKDLEVLKFRSFLEKKLLNQGRYKKMAFVIEGR
jgi:hypothetical protein